MASKVYEVVEVELIDGTTVKMRPLKISLLRSFMEEFQKIGEEEIAEDNVKSMDVLMNCAVIAMKQYNEELSDKEKLEEVVDLPTVYKIIEVASGIKLNDPNVLAAALSGANQTSPPQKQKYFCQDTGRIMKNWRKPCQCQN